MKIYLYCLLLSLSLLISNSAYACSVPAKGTFVTKAGLVDTTDIIVLARYTNKEEKQFNIVEVLKGKPDYVKFNWLRQSRGIHPGYNRYDCDKSNCDKKGHKALFFWKERPHGSSALFHGRCTPMFLEPFVEGEQYLIFVGSIGHDDSREMIRSKDDHWYRFVKDRIEAQKISYIYPPNMFRRSFAINIE